MFFDGSHIMKISHNHRPPRDSLRWLLSAALAALAFCLAPGALLAAEYHVAVSGNDVADGTAQRPWATVTRALKAVEPGDTITIHAGKYKEPDGIFIRKSGRPGKPITIRRNGTDRVLIGKGGPNGMTILPQDDVSHYIIDGLEFDGNGRNGIAAWGDHIIIRNCVFHDSNWGVKANHKEVRHHHILIENCLFYDSADLHVVPHNLDSVVIRNCVMVSARRFGCINPSGVSNLVIENCFLYNPHPQGPVKLIAGTAGGAAGMGPSEANLNGAIIRRNIFLGGEQYAVMVSSANGAVFYNNVLANVGGKGVQGALLSLQREQANPGREGRGGPLAPNCGNVFKNNVFFLLDAGDGAGAGALVNVLPNMAGPGGAGSTKSGGLPPSAQVDIDFYLTQEFRANLYFRSGGGAYVNLLGTALGKDQIKGWGASYDMDSLVGVDPRLTDPRPQAGSEGFAPAAGSPCIDAGTALTEAAADGSGSVIAVKDARYFTDGCGLIEGDLVRIGDNEPVRVVARDIDKNTLTLDKAVTWKRGDAVTLPYADNAPDIGAFESGGRTAVGNPRGNEWLRRTYARSAGQPKDGR